MLHLIVLILKITGTLVFAVLGLLLLGILIIISVPIRYQLKGSLLDTLRGSAKVTWLLHILSVKAVYDQKFVFTVRFFGYRLFKPKRRRVEAEEEFEPLTAQELTNTTDCKEAAKEPKPAKQRTYVKREYRPPEKKSKQYHNKKNGLDVGRWYTRLLTKWKQIVNRICDRLQALKRSKDTVMDWIHDEANQRMVKLILKQVKKLLRHILPQKLRGRIKFGFDDPYLTGQVLSFLSLIHPFYYRQLQLEPVFDQVVLEGEFYLKGRIRLGTLLFCVVRVYLNKNFRVMLKKLLR